MFTVKDFDQMAQLGITREEVMQQIEVFKTGFPFPDIVKAATPRKGIRVMTEKEKSSAERRFMHFNGSACKFIPASGAATRMFKRLYELADSKNYDDIFFRDIRKFAFYDDLEKTGVFNTGDNSYVIKKLLESDGLNYGQLPKGLLKFHRYDNETRTPFEEHLIEAALYARSKDGKVAVTFTVSPEHMELFKELAEVKKREYKVRYGCEYEIIFTTQKRSTDTIAVDLDNNPFRLNNSELLFRPAGHGALIENLNELNFEVVFIKNIDNIPKESYFKENCRWKSILAGVLIEIKEKIFNYIERIENDFSDSLVSEILNFFETELSTTFPKVPDELVKDFLKAKLDRPIRVCGVVENLGEPGGGPYLVRDSDGSVSPQILESAQLNPDDSRVKEIMSGATHFNPVDIVCSFTDHHGEQFDLKRYTDPETGFISVKSVEGKTVKALELPGLWNGGMSNWNTVFVEVPVSTFSPVKTVYDLLREEHQ